MTPNLPPNQPQDDLDRELRRLSEHTHPDPSFVRGLRARLLAEQAAQKARPAPRGPARLAAALRVLFASPALPSWLGQTALVAALLALVLLAGRLVDPRQASQATGLLSETPTPGQPGLSFRETGLPSGARSRMGKGTVTALSSAPDGRLAVGSSAGVCLYGQGMAEAWCRSTSAPVDGLLFDPGGDLLAVHVSEEDTIQIWDARDAHPVTFFQFNLLPEFQESGRSTPALVMAWDPIQTGVPRYTPQPGSPSETPNGDSAPAPTYTPFLSSGDGPRLAVSGWTGELVVWDINHSVIAWAQTGITTPPSALAWAKGPNGESLLALVSSQGMALYDGQTGEARGAITLQAETTGQPLLTNALAISPDERYLAHATNLLALDGFTTSPAAGFDVTAERFAFAPDSNSVAALSGDDLIIYTVPDLNRRQLHKAAAHSPLAWLPDGSLFFVKPDGTLARASADSVDAYPIGYTLPPQALAWENEHTLLTGSSISLHSWDTASNLLTVIRAINQPNLQLLAFSSDGARAAFIDHAAGGLVIWSVADNRVITVLLPGGLPASGGGLLAAAFSADGQEAVIAAADRRLYFYTIDNDNVGQGEAPAPYAAGDDSLHVDALALEPKTGLLAVAYSTAAGPQLDVVTRSGEVRARLPVSQPADVLAWSADGSRLAVAQPDALLLYDSAAFGDPIRLTSDTEKRMAQTVMSYPTTRLAFSPDGSRLAAAATVLTVFDLTSMTETHFFQPPNLPITGLAFSPDGAQLASSSFNGILYTWDLTGQLPGTPGYPELYTPTPPPYFPPIATSTHTAYFPPLPANSTPSPSPVALTTPEQALDLSGYEMTLETYASPYSAWALEYLRGEWTDQAAPNGDPDRAADINRFSLYDGSVQKWVITERPSHLAGESRPLRFTWSADGRYLYIDDGLHEDACGGMLYHNLRRIDLAAGALESISPYVQGQYGVFSLSPDGARIAILNGAQVDLLSLAGGVIETSLPFDPPPGQPEYGAPAAPIWSPSGDRLAVLLRAPFPSCAPAYSTSLVTLDTTSGASATTPLPDEMWLTGWLNDEVLRLVDAQGREFYFNPASGETSPDAALEAPRHALIDAVTNAGDGVYRAFHWLSVPELLSSQPGLERYRVWAEFNAQAGGIYRQNGQTRFAFTLQRLADGQLHLLDPLPGAPGADGLPRYVAHLPAAALAGFSPDLVARALVDEWLSAYTSAYAPEPLLEYEILTVTADRITFSVRPRVMLYSDWVAGNGEIQDGWVRGKLMFIKVVEEDELVHLQLLGTGP